MEIRKTEIFAKWLDGLEDIRARARVLVRIERLAAGNPGDVKPVGEGVSELRINYGASYRVYYIQRGRELVRLLRRLFPSWHAQSGLEGTFQQSLGSSRR